MNVGMFSVEIPEGREHDGGYINLSHGSTYRIRLINRHRDRRCDALVRVDGKEIGLFRINSSGYTDLERPLTDQGKFTFFKADGQEAHTAGGGDISRDDRGLIQVVFKPERPQLRPVRLEGTHRTGSYRSEYTCGGGILRCGHTAPANARSKDAAAGVTGLTGESKQKFYTVDNLDYDPGEEIMISVRLVCKNDVRPLQSHPKSNPVPAALD